MKTFTLTKMSNWQFYEGEKREEERTVRDQL